MAIKMVHRMLKPSGLVVLVLCLRLTTSLSIQESSPIARACPSGGSLVKQLCGNNSEQSITLEVMNLKALLHRIDIGLSGSTI